MMVTVGDRISSVTTRAYSDTGELRWSVDHGATVYGVAIDADNRVYTVGERAGSTTLRVYDVNGQLLWTADHGAAQYAVAVGADGRVVAGGNIQSGVTTRVYSAAGTEITTGWPANHGMRVYGVAVGADGQIVTTGMQSSGITLRSYAADGTAQWTQTGPTNWTGESVAITDDAVYEAGYSGSVQTRARRYDPVDGAIEMTYAHLDDVNITVGLTHAVALRPNGDFVLVGEPIFLGGDGTVTCIMPDKATRWHRTVSGAKFRAVAVNADGGVIVGGDVLSSISTRYYDADGTAGWTANHGATVRGVAWRADAYTHTPPALSLSILSGLPFATGIITLPGLEVPLGMGIPDGEMVFPPERPARPVQRIYRAAISVENATMAYPLLTIQCERRAGTSAWLVAELAGHVHDHTAWIGGEILVWAGYRDEQGDETMGLFLRAIITEIHFQETPSESHTTVTGRIQNPTFSAATRIAQGVRAQRTDQGRRNVVMAVDPLLRPNDWLLVGEALWRVGSIRYRIAPGMDEMHVTEVISG